jgi:PKD repeat protein
MRKLGLSILLAMLLGSMAIIAIPAIAQSEICEWVQYLDFTIDDYGFMPSLWTGEQATLWESGRGFYTEYAPDAYAPGGSAVQAVTASFGTGSIFTQFVMTSVEVFYDVNATDLIGGPTLGLRPNSNPGVQTLVNVSNGTGSYLFNTFNPTKAGYYDFQISLGVQSGSAPYEGYGTISALNVRGEGWNPFTNINNCEVRAIMDVTPISGNVPLTVKVADKSVNADTISFNLGDGNTTTAGYFDHTYTEAGIYTITLTATNEYGSDDATQTVEVIDGNALPNLLYKPLKTEDTGEFGIFDYEDAYTIDPGYGDDLNDSANHLLFLDAPRFTVFANSNDPNDDVHAVADGTAFLKKVDCSAFINASEGIELIQNLNSQCLVKIPGPIIQNASITSGKEYVYRLDTSNLYQVMIKHPSGKVFLYYIDSPYVEDGDEVTAGCIIGQTMKMFHLVGGEAQGIYGGLGGGGLNYALDSQPTAGGMAFLVLLGQDDDTNQGGMERLRPLLFVEPTSTTPCNKDPRFSSCLIPDPELENPSDWEVTGGVVWEPGSQPTLQRGAQISSKLNLSPNTPYSMTAQIRLVGSGTGKVNLRLGQTNQDFDINISTQEISLPLEAHEPDYLSLYTASVLNTGSISFQILSICVSEDGEISAPATCLFRNPSFDDGTTGWSVSTGVSSGFSGGELIMGDGATIAQTISLYPNGAESYAYDVTIRASVYGANWSAETASEVGFEWQFPAAGDWEPFTSPASTTTYPFSGFKNDRPNNITFFPGNEVLFETLVPIDSVTNGAFTIRSIIELEGGFTGGLLIREVCVNDPFQNWPDPDRGIGLPFEPSCRRVSAPTDEDLSSWTFYLWANLDRFFQCDLMVVLNRIASSIFETLRFARWQLLYFQSVISSFADWLNAQLLPWINGHFRNMAIGQITTITQAPSENLGLWDLLYLLIDALVRPFFDFIISTLTRAVDLLLDVVQALLVLLLLLFGEAVKLLQSLFWWMKELVDAWNNTAPIPIEGMPDCSASWSSSPFCMAAYVLENTAFSGNGALFIPLILAFGSINLILWVVSTLRDTVEDIGRNS